MHLQNETEAKETIEKWRDQTPAAQLSKLKKALEGIELDLMYYEQKGNSKGIERCGTCLELLQKRIDELENPKES